MVKALGQITHSLGGSPRSFFGGQDEMVQKNGGVDGWACVHKWAGGGMDDEFWHGFKGEREEKGTQYSPSKEHDIQ